ncbi:hypothetical protein CLV90_0995 [Maribacter spongiicola]|uniref:Uncharacterized protein n=1 Tax=Maribacter spongiicola TaxID=1206753 RepID=A0A4R7K790_9FLAO|nr:hypothetical protein CLV90_0995 [Maribacter spongiicola]
MEEIKNEIKVFRNEFTKELDNFHKSMIKKMNQQAIIIFIGLIIIGIISFL